MILLSVKERNCIMSGVKKAKMFSILFLYCGICSGICSVIITATAELLQAY